MSTSGTSRTSFWDSGKSPIVAVDVSSTEMRTFNSRVVNLPIYVLCVSKNTLAFFESIVKITEETFAVFARRFLIARLHPALARQEFSSFQAHCLPISLLVYLSWFPVKLKARRRLSSRNVEVYYSTDRWWRLETRNFVTPCGKTRVLDKR